jgi:predicted metalloendopeptidase
MRPERLRYLATADVHSTPRERVNGTVANLPAFFRAFGCPVPENLPPSIW